MPNADRKPVTDPIYSTADLLALRRRMLQYSRSIPPGPERNQHLQIAVSLRRLFKNKEWLDAHTAEGAQ
jgi:hypothetical protein